MFQVLTFTLFCIILVSSQSPPLQTAEVTYDGVYDLSDLPVANISCNTQPFFSKYSVIGDIPNWPNVGGGFAVTEFGPEGCGTCWALTYPETNQSAAVLIIDAASPGFNIAESTMNRLTNGMAERLGIIYAEVEELPLFECGISS